MRINVYSEELTTEVEMVFKSPENHPNETFRGVRMYLKSPDVLHNDPADDDRSAITIWVPWTKAGGHDHQTVIELLTRMTAALQRDLDSLRQQQ